MRAGEPLEVWLWVGAGLPPLLAYPDKKLASVVEQLIEHALQQRDARRDDSWPGVVPLLGGQALAPPLYADETVVLLTSNIK